MGCGKGGMGGGYVGPHHYFIRRVALGGRLRVCDCALRLSYRGDDRSPNYNYGLVEVSARKFPMSAKPRRSRSPRPMPLSCGANRPDGAILGTACLPAGHSGTRHASYEGYHGRRAFQAAVLKVRPRRAVKGPVAPPQKAWRARESVECARETSDDGAARWSMVGA
eukprot:scaffold48159_cov81-Phaeocystis_antarctica.AAC.2